jgi:uncharacterized repeat protein (TIGR03943 family)
VTAAGGTISILAGTVLLRLTLTGTYTRYVRPGMGPWLAIAGVLVIALGVVTLLRALLPRGSAGSDSGDGHGTGHRERGRQGHGGGVGWLLLAPVAALLLVAPPTLGSYGVDRGAAVDVRSGVRGFDAVDSSGGPVPMTLLEYSQRAFDRSGESLDGATVELTGFVADDGHDEGFRLARYQIACCAADAAPVVVRVVGVHGAVPSRDQWVTVTGSLRTGDTDVPELAATSVVEIAAPNDPYE